MLQKTRFICNPIRSVSILYVPSDLTV